MRESLGMTVTAEVRLITMSRKGFNLICCYCDTLIKPRVTSGARCPDLPIWKCPECGFIKVSDVAALVEREYALRSGVKRPYDEQADIILKETKPLGTKEYKWNLTE
jgi:RNase P subunit RPR2